MQANVAFRLLTEQKEKRVQQQKDFFAQARSVSAGFWVTRALSGGATLDTLKIRPGAGYYFRVQGFRVEDLRFRGLGLKV